MNANQKGKRGERAFRDVLRQNGYEARRGQQFSGSPDSPDVVSNLPIHFEVKNTEALRLWDAVAQAEGDSQGRAWAVATKRNRGEWLIIQTASDWFKAIRGDYADVKKTDCPTTTETRKSENKYETDTETNSTDR